MTTKTAYLHVPVLISAISKASAVLTCHLFLLPLRLLNLILLLLLMLLPLLLLLLPLLLLRLPFYSYYNTAG